eukprot:GHVT01069852.1.p1 GENE.GHVT01069852.1~~GHVT01069852.1.p1  ORF type:complete len:470 (+),score=7.37 GHVT01069852.1:175-1584(+)
MCLRAFRPLTWRSFSGQKEMTADEKCLPSYSHVLTIGGKLSRSSTTVHLAPSKDVYPTRPHAKNYKTRTILVPRMSAEDLVVARDVLSLVFRERGDCTNAIRDLHHMKKQLAQAPPGSEFTALSDTPFRESKSLAFTVNSTARQRPSLFFPETSVRKALPDHASGGAVSSSIPAESDELRQKINPSRQIEQAPQYATDACSATLAGSGWMSHPFLRARWRLVNVDVILDDFDALQHVCWMQPVSTFAIAMCRYPQHHQRQQWLERVVLGLADIPLVILPLLLLRLTEDRRAVLRQDAGIKRNTFSVIREELLCRRHSFADLPVDCLGCTLRAVALSGDRSIAARRLTAAAMRSLVERVRKRVVSKWYTERLSPCRGNFVSAFGVDPKCGTPHSGNDSPHHDVIAAAQVSHYGQTSMKTKYIISNRHIVRCIQACASVGFPLPRAICRYRHSFMVCIRQANDQQYHFSEK